VRHGLSQAKEHSVVRELLIRVIQSEDGQDLIEYSLLIGIITLASVIAMTSIGGKIAAYFTGLDTAMP
jgi:Flp pilus assembly pilin Flp